MTNSTNNQKQRLALIGRSALTGFVGGILGCTAWSVMYYFNFSQFAPKNFILGSWIEAVWTEGWKGDLVSIIITGFLSVLIALIYYVTSKKVNSIFIGLVYGLILWLAFFYLLLPIIPNIKSIGELNSQTIVSTICLFALYGIFIGYSISYDYFDTYVYRVKKQSS